MYNGTDDQYNAVLQYYLDVCTKLDEKPEMENGVFVGKSVAIIPVNIISYSNRRLHLEYPPKNIDQLLTITANGLDSEKLKPWLDYVEKIIPSVNLSNFLRSELRKQFNRLKRGAHWH
jgi:hypothetical protein